MDRPRRPSNATTRPGHARSVDPLIAVLTAEVRELGRLLALTEEQERALVRGDAAALETTLARHTTALHAIAGLEAERRECVATVATAVGTRPERLTLSMLLTLVPDVAPRLATLRGELRRMLGRLATVNARNSYLIGRARELLDGLAQQLVGALGPEPSAVYVRSGRPDRSSAPPRLIDRRA